MNENQGTALTIARWVIYGMIIGAVGCSNNNSDGSATATASPTVAPYDRIPYTFATESPTPIPANPSELSSLVWRFYHDIAEASASGTKDLGSILTPSFLATHRSTWTRDYGFITNPNVAINGVRGSAVDYTVEYDYLTEHGGKLHWRRSGTWVAAHGSPGWELGEDKWSADHIISVTNPNGTSYDVNDRVYADGRHVFEVPGLEVTFIASNDKGWRTTVVPLATPTPAVANVSPPESYAAAPGSSYYAAPDCDEDSIQTVGDDGSILEMLSGAVYRVAAYDTPTSSIWLATEDVLICGSRIVNKDESGEAVDAQRVR